LIQASRELSVPGEYLMLHGLFHRPIDPIPEKPIMRFLLAATLLALLAVRAAADFNDGDDANNLKWYDKPEVEGSYRAPPGRRPGSYTGPRVGEGVGDGDGYGDGGHDEPDADGRMSDSDGKYWKPQVTQVLWGQCGGYYYKGTDKCPKGAYCRRFSNWYSQCNPLDN